MWTGLAGWLGFGSGFVYDWADLGMFYKVCLLPSVATSTLDAK